jgi:hypothetical protein
MKFPDWLPVYGDASFRGKCPREDVELASFFNRLRREYPTSWGLLGLHPRNEALLEKGQFSTVIKHKAEGMTAGASDIVIPGRVTFVCEVKRRDHTLSKWQDGQEAYLRTAHEAGAFACVGLGAIGAWEGFETWKFIL